MPYKYKKVGDKYVVYKKDTGKRVGSTAGTKAALKKYLAALHINANENVNMKTKESVNEAITNLKLNFKAGTIKEGKYLAQLKKLYEDLQIAEADDEQFQSKLQQIFKQNYQGFVSALGKFATDPKFRQFIKNADAEKSDVNLTAISVTKLIPTQNEIDVDKSLQFPLTKAQAAAYALKGGSVKIASPIIVFNGKYIVDGHHRWSQLYAMNKDAKIVAYNFTNPEIKKPLDALKLTQVAILGAGAIKIPRATVEGNNLLKMDEAAIKQYVVKTTKEDVVDVFTKMKQLNTKETIADYIWENCSSMQQTSQPVPNAPGRGIMPQADAVPGGLPKTIATLKQGVPALTELRNYIREYIKEELAKKDYDGDGKVESPEAEYKGSRDKAIKKAMKKDDKA